MVRRRLTLKRIDPWSVLKFGFVANLSLLAIGMLGAAVIWFFIERLRLIDQVCEIALELGFQSCGVDGGNLLRALFLLGLLGVVVATGLMVFLAFLFNLIADLVGGLTFSFVDETPGAAARGDVPATGGRAVGTVTESAPAEPRRAGPPPPLGSEEARRQEEERRRRADEQRRRDEDERRRRDEDERRRRDEEQRRRAAAQTAAAPPPRPAPGPTSPPPSSGSTGNPGAGPNERMWDTQRTPRDPNP